ncbi:hypothetical protein CsSME_00012270 [Camellia sinensis var. sinensis]
MASYGTNTTTHRPSPTTTTSSPPSTTSPPDESKASTRKSRQNFTLIFNLPTTPEAAAVRIIRNLNQFKAYYTMFILVVLSIALIPQRKISLLFLMGTSTLTCLYLLLVQSLPESKLLHEIIDKRLVLFLVVIVIMIEMILTSAAIHFFVTVAATTPVIVVHAVLWVREYVFVGDEACAAGELVPLVYTKNTSDVEPLDSV